MAWVNIPASTSLLTEVNYVGSPSRNKAQDGTIGDGEHSTSPSDHNPDETGYVEGESDSDNINEVHARDVDARGPWKTGWSAERIVQVILARCRSGAEKRLRYIIFNRRIWSRDDGWIQRAYSGGDSHSTHIHFSFRYGSGSAPSNPEQVTTAWGLRAAEDNDMPNAQDVVDAFVADLKDSSSDLFANMRAIGWKYPVDGDATPRSALRVTQDVDAAVTATKNTVNELKAQLATVAAQVQVLVDAQAQTKVQGSAKVPPKA
jgi:hypothetical protein